MPHSLRFSVCGFVLLACLVGCGQRDGRIAISGTVSYDGQPVNKGIVTFVPADGKGPTAAATIVDGKYSVKVAPGKKVVKIEGFKVTGQRHYNKNPNSPMVDQQEQIIPPCYNAKSELTREITSADKTCDFALDKPLATPRSPATHR
jgi:hypothetical protein